MNKRWSFNKVASYLILAMALGTLVASCGGGGNSAGTGGTGAVLSYLADQQGGGFLGRWWYASSGAASAVKADENTLVANGTSQYAGTTIHKILSGGSWVPNTNPDVYYDLISSGWFASPDTVTLVDNGDGRNVTITPTGEPALVATVTKTSLANTPITCTNSAGATIPCAVPGVYPAGAASYRLTVSYSSSQYELYGPTIAQPITDSSGTALTTLPALNTTFCDPALSYVFQQQSAGLYKVWPTTSCAAGAITTAILAASPDGTVTMDRPGTGNASVANVLHVQSATGNAFVSGMVNMIYGARASAVWYGWMLPIGTYQLDPEYNKTAINAQLLGDGLVVLP